MKNIYICTILLVTIAFISCQKADDSFKGNSEVNGVLYINNPLTDNGANKSLKDVEIFIQNGENNINGYMYSVKSDNLGKFKFSFLNLKKNADNYTIYSRYTDTDSKIMFSGKISINSESDIDLILTPDATQQNGFLIKLIESDSSGAVPNFPVCVFTSVLAGQTDTCQFSAYSGNTDNFGRFLQLNMPQGKYYILAKDTTNTVQSYARDSFEVDNYGITIKNVYFQN